MSEYTQTCPHCETCRKHGGDFCGVCRTVRLHLEAFLCSRANRLHAHALLMRAEEAAGCEQSRLLNEMLQSQHAGFSSTLGPRPPGPGHVPLGMSQWTPPQSLEEADKFTA